MSEQSGLFGMARRAIRRTGQVVGLVDPSPKKPLMSYSAQGRRIRAAEVRAETKLRRAARAAAVQRQSARAQSPRQSARAQSPRQSARAQSPRPAARAQSPRQAPRTRRASAALAAQAAQAAQAAEAAARAAAYQPSMFVAAGTNGCVYRPRMRCEKRTFEGRSAEDTVTRAEQNGERYVSKLCDSSVCDDERAEVMRPVLTEVDPNQRFHIGPRIICTPSDRSKEDHNMPKNNCDSVRRGINGARMLLMHDGGPDLNRYVTTDIPAVNADRELMQRIKRSIKAFKNLFTGLSLINEKNFYHNDIKPGNIITGYDPVNPIFKFIDFGMAYTMLPNAALPTGWDTDIRKLNLYSHKYPYWPLDSNILLSSEQTQGGVYFPFNPDHIDMYVRNWVDHMFQFPFIRYFFLNGAANGNVYPNRAALIPALVADLTRMHRARGSARAPVRAKYSNNNILRKIDIYSLSISLIQTVESLYENPQLELPELMLEFIVQNKVLYVDSSQRPTASELAPRYIAFLQRLTRERLI